MSGASRRPTRRRGFNLVELTVVMVLLVFLLSLIATTLWGTIRIERTDSAAFQRTIRHSGLGDRFRDDVAKATAAPAKVAEHVAGKECLILVHPPSAHIVYSWKNNRLERIELSGDETQRQTIPVEHDWKVEFALDEKNERIVVLRLFQIRKDVAFKHPVEFQAALGGDVK